MRKGTLKIGKKAFCIKMMLWLGGPCLRNKRNQNLPAEIRNFPKPKFGSGFVPAHFQAALFCPEFLD